MEAYGHQILTEEEQEKFIFSRTNTCPVCNCKMVQEQNPTGGDSWWFTCINKHATWIGK